MLGEKKKKRKKKKEEKNFGNAELEFKLFSTPDKG
jgi:hypothetical protein